MKDVVMAGVGQEGTQYTAASLLSPSQHLSLVLGEVIVCGSRGTPRCTRDVWLCRGTLK